MSFTRTTYDQCDYATTLRESIGTGQYYLGQPKVCETCWIKDPYVRMDKIGASICEDSLIDVDSELHGLNVKLSRCPEKQYLPSDKPFCKTTDLQDCPKTTAFLASEDTRLSNPACNIRESTINRFEFLTCNPQDQAITPYETNMQSRMIAKDNHRPCIPKLINQQPALPIEPPSAADPFYTATCTFTGPQEPPFIQNLRSCEEIKRL